MVVSPFHHQEHELKPSTMLTLPYDPEEFRVAAQIPRIKAGISGRG